MAEEQRENSDGSRTQPNPTSTSVGGFNVGENIDKGVVVIGNNNVVQYASEVKKNSENHESDFWALKHPYPMPPHFTGRIHERATLTQWLKDDSENRLFILRALGGFGKSALTWHWLTHDVDSKEWSEVVFWSFYEGDARFENFITETLQYLKLEVPQGGRSQVDKLLDAMQSRKVLLIMDGFERALRLYARMDATYQSDEEQKIEDNQFDCKDINAEWFLKGICVRPNIKSKVLMTTRLTPRAIKPHGEFMLGCREEELTAMQKADAVEFFNKQKIKGTRAEIEAACAPYGYHPLSLRLLAGRILKDFENPADIAVAQKIKIDGDLKARQHHVLEISYNSLPSHEQTLLNIIACFRSPVELKTLQSIAVNKDTLDTDLHDLIDRGLLQYTARLVSNHPISIFDLHPIVHRYVYERLTIRDRTAAHIRLRDHFAAVDVVAGTQTLDDLAPVIELYYHTVRAGEYEAAYDIYTSRISDSVFYGLGEYQTLAELIEVLLPSNLSPTENGRLMTRIASCYANTGQIKNAIILQEKANSFLKDNRYDFLTGLISLADNQRQVGSLRLTESNLRASINFSKGIEDDYHEAYGHTELGRLLSFRGMWDEVDQELELSIIKDTKRENLQGLGVAQAYLALCALLKTRDRQQMTAENQTSIIKFAQRALELATETARTVFPIERDFIRAYWLLGAAYCLDGQLDLAESYLSEALTRDRVINMIDHEADILLDLARLRYDQKNYEEAKSLAEEALTITERCGYVLQGADVNLFLAQYALEQEKDKAKAKEYVETALKLAYCDGPPYYYKVAYHEAERFLENLK